MTQNLILKLSGLYTSFNTYSEAPDGALIEAQNIEISKPGIAEPRRGFDRDGGMYPNNERADSIDEVGGAIHTLATTDQITWTLYHKGLSTWDSRGIMQPVAGRTWRWAKSNQNSYLTTNLGPLKVGDYPSNLTYMGMPEALDMTIAVNSASPAWLPLNHRVAYRAVWTYVDAKGNRVIGAPSQRYSFKNTSSSLTALNIVVTTPRTGLPISAQVYLYRSETVDNTASDIEPSDEMQLVAIDSWNLSATKSTLLIPDVCAEDARGALLYTSATQEGLAFQNFSPPTSLDIAQYDSTMFYGNTSTPPQYFLTLASVGGLKGLMVGDTLTIASVAGTTVLTAASSEVIGSNQFKVETGGTEAENIRATTDSLIRVLNRGSNQVFVSGYSMSGPFDPPGQIRFQSPYNFGLPTFYVTSSRASCWTPNLPSSGTTQASTTDAFINGLFWSKPNQPEHVPLPNFVQVGSKNDPIMRIVPLRDALFIFKKREGIFKLSGTYPNYQVELFDASTRLIASESAKVVDNQIFCLTDKGVAVIADTTTLISAPIVDELMDTVLPNLENVDLYSFGVSNNPEMKYYLFIPLEETDTYCPLAYVFNLKTMAWTKHLLPSRAGYVAADKKMRTSPASSPYLFSERKSYTFLDYADYGFNTNMTSIVGRRLKFFSGFDNIAVGDIIYQTASKFASVVSIDLVNQDIIVDTDPGFVLGDTIIYKAVRTKITWAPQALANPGILKRFHTTTLMFKQGFNGTGQLTYTSDLSPGPETVDVSGDRIGLWGIFPWGQAPWGGQIAFRTVRQWVPRNKQQAGEITVTFSHNFGFSTWKLIGLSLFGNPAQEKISK